MIKSIRVVPGVALAALCGCATLTPSGKPTDAARVGSDPMSWAARRLSEWIAAYNIGSLDALTAFADSNFSRGALAKRSATDRAASDKWLHLNLGNMTIRSIDSTTDSSIVATVWQELVEGWGHIVLGIEPIFPFRIASRQVSFLEPPPEQLRFRMDIAEDQIAAELSRFALKLAEAGVFSGVVSVFRRGQPLYVGAFGLAQRDPPVPNSVDTRFELASVSKMFTAVAVARLVEQRRLSYQDTVSKLLPDYPNRALAARLTVQHLLTHTSGLPEYLFTPAYRAGRMSVRSPLDYWPFFANDTLEFPPGSKWSYSSSNYVLLGAIVERVSGRPFVEYVHSSILAPLGMTRSSYQANAQATATPFTRFGPDRRPDLQRYHAVERAADSRGSPAGGGFSTAPDLQRFANALLSGTLLSDKSTREATMPRVKAEDGMWSFGFEWHEWNGVRFFGHNGFSEGAFNQVDIYPDLGYTVVVLSNVDMSGAGAIAYKLRMLLTHR